MSNNDHAHEIAAGERFEFGENWANFLRTLDDEKIREAERSLKEMLGTESLDGRRFIDVGSGSGLSSLAARRLGAVVKSIDYDPASVACTRALRQRYCADDPDWQVDSGSILDLALVLQLGKFDIVYCWGVAHHTGQMWIAIDNLMKLVGSNGLCWVALYNTGSYSRRWKIIKRMYCKLPKLLRPAYALATILSIQIMKFWSALIRFKACAYIGEIRNYRKHRGMSWWHDQIDWIGGYPYETATPAEVFDYFSHRGFRLRRLITVGGGTGCNQFLFEREQGCDPVGGTNRQPAPQP